MDAITVSSFPEDNAPPVGVIEQEDAFTVVLPLSEVVVFIAVESAHRNLLAATMEQALEAIRNPAADGSQVGGP